MAYTHADQIIAAQAIGDVSTTKKHQLGTEVRVFDNANNWAGTAMYVAFPVSTAVAAGALLSFQTPDGVVTTSPFRVIATVGATLLLQGGPVFVCLTAVASNAAVQYGWVLVDGVAPTLKTAIKPISTDLVFLSTSAGRMYVTTTSIARKIVGCRIVQSSVTTTTSLVNIYYDRAHVEGAAN